MRFLVSAPVFIAAGLTLARPARADDDWPPRVSAVRIGITGTAGYASLGRDGTASTNVGALAIGGEVRVHPYSPSGFVVGVIHGEGIFGPTVNIFDAAYSFMLAGSRRLDGVTGAAYFEIGPSLGFVRYASPDPDHAVLGGRVSFAGDLQWQGLTLGAAVGVRGGVPLSTVSSSVEGAVTVFLRGGFVFDVAGD